MLNLRGYLLKVLYIMKIQNFAYFFICFIGIVTMLIYGQHLLIPIIFALLLWFIIKDIRQFMDKSSWLARLPSWLKNFSASILMIAVLSFVSTILLSSINSLAKSYTKYEPNFTKLVSQIDEYFGIDLMVLMKNQLGSFDYGSLLNPIFASISDILSNAFMIIIYTLFLFLEETNFRTKLKNVFPNKERYNSVSSVLVKIEESVSKYIGIKTLVSLLTGFVSFLVLYLIGIESPSFWAFLIFLLNYIPTVGSLIATVFPASFCLLQFESYTPAILVLVLVGVIQVLVGNVIEPKMIGNSMNISPLVTIIALTFWGLLWGVTGMILSVPITVILTMIFAQFDKTRPFAILMSEKGSIS